MDMLPFKLGRVTVTQVPGPVSEPDRLYVTAKCEECGATFTGEIYDNKDSLIHCANSLMRWVCPENGHGKRRFWPGG